MNEKAPSEKHAKQKMEGAGGESSLPAMPCWTFVKQPCMAVQF